MISNNMGCNGLLGDFIVMFNIVYIDFMVYVLVMVNLDFNQGIGIFIDWNQDMDFGDFGEFYFNGNIIFYFVIENIVVIVFVLVFLGII